MSAWSPILDVNTPAAMLPVIIAEAATDCVAVLRAQLQGNPELTPAQRLRMEAFAAPIILARTTEAIEAGWTALQIEAGRVS
jgi:hypothetical protein